MNNNEIVKWWKVIDIVTKELDDHRIVYSIDASSSLFVHGINIEMDDLDVMIQWDSYYKSHEVFKKYTPTEIKVDGIVQDL